MEQVVVRSDLAVPGTRGVLVWRRAKLYGICRVMVAGLLAIALILSVGWAYAQTDVDDGMGAGIDESEIGGAVLRPEEANAVLALPLPAEPNARYTLLQRQYRAAQLLEERGRLIEIARQLADAGRGRPGGEEWITKYLNAEFTWGSSGKAFAACDEFVADNRLSIGARATVALRQTYFAANGHDRKLLARLWSNADDLARQAMKAGAAMPPRLPVDRLQVRSEIERWEGDSAASVATLREAVRLGRRDVAAARARSHNRPHDPDVLDAYGWLDGSMGMLTYALVRQGRSPEAIEIAQSNLALWQSGQISEGLGARWNYRLAMALNATQQYAPALAAAQRSDDMLQRAGSSAASHTRWMARQEIVRALIGLKRWKEADESYGQFLASMPPDVLARTRASDWRLLPLLAAKNGRFDAALEMIERSYRYRVRLFGEDHPQTREAAGVRAVVRLLRGDVRGAMSDYETLFAATLDSPEGWQDLDLRGVRRYVFGIAFNEFMHYVANQAMAGETVDPALVGRALQVADRSNLSVTQTALTDSTARLLANTAGLRDQLEQEQARRHAAAALFSKLNGALGEEDQLRRETRTEAFKALPPEARKAHAERLQAVRESIKVQQAEAAAARGSLKTLREQIAKEFPAYADLVAPTTPRPEQLRRLLQPGEAMLVVYPTDEATFVWLVRTDRPDGFSVSKLSRTDLVARVGELRGMMDIGAKPVGFEPPLDRGKFYALYRDLLGPLAASLSGVESLIVASEGPLASLPFGALLTEAPVDGAEPAWLIKRMAVTQIPSPSALQSLRRVAQPPLAAKPLIGFGDPAFRLDAGKGTKKDPRPATDTRKTRLLIGVDLRPEATRYDAEWGFRYGDIPPLPETRTELLAIAGALGANPGTDLVLGAKATRRAVLEANLLDRRTVAFATHGLMPGELPGVSKPALAMAVERDEHQSPLLELDDILALRLNAQWVLLSACNTAAGEQGGSAMSGLVRGFFFAGGRSVLATHWAVDSESAAALSAATFKNFGQGTATRSASLRQAQMAMIDGQLGDGRWKHPFYWAAYALFGDPAR